MSDEKRAPWSSVLRVLSGAVIGTLLGFYVTLAVVVAKARAGYYIFAVHDLADIRIETAIILVGLVLGAMFAYRWDVRFFRVVLRGLVGLIAGVLLGIPLGWLIWGGTEGMWAGGIIFSALALLGTLGLAGRKVQQQRFTMLDAGAGFLVTAALAVSLIIGLRDPEAIAVPEIEPVPLPPIENIEQVIFFFGDAGATLPGGSPQLRALQADVEQWSARLARESAVSVVFPGDLVYPVGVRDRDDPMFEQDSIRLWNQIELVGGPEARRYRSLGLLVPGNHDWGNTNAALGLDRIRNLEQQIDIAQSRGYPVSLQPQEGAPGPVVRDVRDNVRFLLMDTHWFLRNRDRAGRGLLLEQLEDAMATAGDRHTIIVSHHPYQSAGPHGAILPGYHSWGVAHLLRKSGSIVQDVNSPVYDELRLGMEQVFARHGPPLAYIGGHDHSLQVIEGEAATDPSYILVSGSGSKLSSLRSLPNMHFGAARPGYMMLILRKDGAMDLFIVAGRPDLLKCTAEEEITRQACMTLGENTYDLVYGFTIATAPNRPTSTDTLAAAAVPADTTADADAPTVANAMAEVPTDAVAPNRSTAWWMRGEIRATDSIAEADEDLDIPPPAVPARVLYFEPDSVRTTPGVSYLAGDLYSLLMGDLNRHLWDVPVTLPVLDLDALGGGITVDELSGGRQTVGMRMTGANGVTYQFRSIVKIASRGLDSELEKAALEGAVQDQLAAQFPFGAMVVAELLEAVDVLVAKPRPIVMPNDDRLGAYRPYFAGRVGWIEERPNERPGDAPGFEGSRKVVGGYTLFDRLREDPAAYADTRAYLRARMIDLLVGDWDRHADNWRWARFDEAGGARWVPIPRDRDWAFSRTDGLAARVTDIAFPKRVSFGEEIPEMDRISRAAHRLDQRVLAGVPRQVFEAEARAVEARLTDSVLAAAVGVLPPEHLALERERMMQTLQARRAQLVEAAGELYEYLTVHPSLFGYDGVVDTVRIDLVGEDQVRLRQTTPGLLAPVEWRVPRARLQEVRLFLEPRDIVRQPESPALPVRILRPEEAGGQ